MAAPTIDTRLIYPKSEPEVVENFNRVCALLDAVVDGLDALTERVAALEPEPDPEPEPATDDTEGE